jgi:hypothetical protein
VNVTKYYTASDFDRFFRTAEAVENLKGKTNYQTDI